MLFGVKGEGIDVDTISWCVSVMLIRLDIVEVSTFTAVEAVVAVKLDKSKGYWVAGTVNENTEVAFVDADIVYGWGIAAVAEEINW